MSSAGILNSIWAMTAGITLPLRRRSSPASIPNTSAAAAVQGPTARCTRANNSAVPATAATPARADVSTAAERLRANTVCSRPRKTNSSWSGAHTPKYSHPRGNGKVNPASGPGSCTRDSAPATTAVKGTASAKAMARLRVLDQRSPKSASVAPRGVRSKNMRINAKVALTIIMNGTACAMERRRIATSANVGA